MEKLILIIRKVKGNQEIIPLTICSSTVNDKEFEVCWILEGDGEWQVQGGDKIHVQDTKIRVLIFSVSPREPCLITSHKFFRFDFSFFL